MSFRKEPVAWLTLFIAIAQTVVKVLNGESLVDIFSQDWIQYLVLTFGGVVVRQSVYSPATVQKLVSGNDSGRGSSETTT